MMRDGSSYCNIHTVNLQEQSIETGCRSCTVLGAGDGHAHHGLFVPPFCSPRSSPTSLHPGASSLLQCPISGGHARSLGTLLRVQQLFQVDLLHHLALQEQHYHALAS